MKDNKHIPKKKLLCKIFGHKRIDGKYEDKILPYCDRCNTDLPLIEIKKNFICLILGHKDPVIEFGYTQVGINSFKVNTTEKEIFYDFCNKKRECIRCDKQLLNKSN